MTYDEFMSDRPLHRTISFKSAEENEETLRRYGVNQEVRQLGKGKFRSDLAVLDTQEAALFSIRYNTAISLQLEPPAGTVGIVFPRSANGQFLASGINTGNDKLIVLPDGSATDIVVPGLAGSEDIAVPQARFTELIEVLCPTTVRLEATTVIAGNTAQLHAPRKAVLALVAQPESDQHPEQVANLVAEAIAWICDSSNQCRADGIKVNGARARVAKRTRELMEEHFREPIRIEDLCRETGVGVRSLQRCFREYFALTIRDYLKTVRLDATRRALVAAQPSVTDIALRHGITHLGRFSIAFRERFGETPRQTLAVQAALKSAGSSQGQAISLAE